MKKHFVVFSSPGTFFHEETQLPIDSWNVDEAVEMSKGIVERYGSKPFGFRFVTNERSDDMLDSKVTARSPMYFLGGTILTLDDVKARNDSANDILIRNMESNGYARVVENTNSWKITIPLNDNDVVLTV